MIRDTLSVEAGDVRLAVYVSGPRDAPPIVLVHGYPDSAAVWEPVRAQLDARYRVISYDVRGAGASDAPSRARLTGSNGWPPISRPSPMQRAARGRFTWSDTTGVRFKAGKRSPIPPSKAALRRTRRSPGRASIMRRSAYAALALVMMLVLDRAEQPNAHQTAKRPFGSGLRQTLKSWYIFFFHLPLLPELVWRAGGARMWPLWLRLTERVRPERDPAQMRNAINGLNLYRANFIDKLLHPRARHAHAPVQFIVPLRDRYVGPELSIGLEGWLGRV